MKKTNFLWMGALALSLVAATGCVKDQAVALPEANEDGQLTIGIKAAGPAASRSLIDTGGDIANQILALEKQIVGFTAYVFNGDNGMFEKAATSTTGSEVIITGLNTNTPKRVVVVANGSGLANSTIPVYSVGQMYDGMATGRLDIRDQVFPSALLSTILADLTGNTKGLLMTGEYDAIPATPAIDYYEMVAGGTNEIEIPVERVVAKIVLGNVSFGDGVTVGDLLRFRVTGASVQRVAAKSPITPYPADIINIPGAGEFYGGWGTQTDGSTPASESAALSDLVDMGGLIDQLVLGILNNLTSISVLTPVTTPIGALLGSFDPATGDLGTLIDQILAIGIPVTGPTVGEILNGISVGVLGNLVSGLVTSLEVGGFWYVNPNNPGTDFIAAADPYLGAGKCTLLTLSGNFDGTDYFYPVRVNDPKAVITGTGNAGVANKYIQRNTIYRVNIEFTGSLVGTPDPDSPETAEQLKVTIVPVDWYGSVDQNATW